MTSNMPFFPIFLFLQLCSKLLIFMKTEVISSECPFMEIKAISVSKEAVQILNSFCISAVSVI